MQEWTAQQYEEWLKMKTNPMRISSQKLNKNAVLGQWNIEELQSEKNCVNHVQQMK